MDRLQSIESGRELLDKAIAFGVSNDRPVSSLGNRGLENGESKPLPLQRQLPSPTPFPVDALGPILGNGARAMGDSIQAPVAICGNSVLASAALAAQGIADVVIDGRSHPIGDYFITIGETGERKSAVDQVALWPHRKYQESLMQKYKDEHAEYQRKYDAYKQAHDEALRGKAKDFDAKKRALDAIKDKKPDEPLEPLLLCEEPTYEGLVRLFAHGQPSVGLFSDEGGRFIGGHGMNADNLLKTAAGMSSLWDGRPISRVRAGDGAALLPGKRLCCHLMMQPDISRLMLSNSVLLAQGLLSRCLVTWPASTAGERFYRDIDLTQSVVLKTYNARMLDMLEIPKLMREGTRNELAPRKLTLRPDAKTVWIEFHNAVEEKLKDGSELAQIRGLANKAPEHATRLAGVLALVEDTNCTSISLQWIEAGIELTTHYINEALRLYDAGVADPQIVKAQKLLDWLKPRKGQTVSVVEIYQNGPSFVRTAKAARELLLILNDHGHIVPAPMGTEYAGTHRREAIRVL